MIVATNLCGIAFAGDTTNVQNVQLDNNPFTSGLNVVVGDVTDVTAASTALGNTVSVLVDTGDLVVDNQQTLTASGQAQSVVTVNSANNSLDSLASTFGNSATITTCCGTINGVSTQSTAAGTTIASTSDVNITDWAIDPTSSASAVGNALAYETWGGDLISAWGGQTNDAAIDATATIDGPLLADSATATATSVGNSAQMGGENTTLAVDANQTNTATSVSSTASITSANGEDSIATATASGNNYSVENAFGFADVTSTQDNNATITAQSDLTLTDWEGWNASSAYAVANSTIASNIGSDLQIDNTQFNDGTVTATADFAGGNAGGVGANGITDVVVSSAAFGNAVSGYICTTCGGGVTATNHQTNSATISASTTVVSGNGGAIVATASAVGNSATFHTVDPGGD